MYLQNNNIVKNGKLQDTFERNIWHTKYINQGIALINQSFC